MSDAEDDVFRRFSELSVVEVCGVGAAPGERAICGMRQVAVISDAGAACACAEEVAQLAED